MDWLIKLENSLDYIEKNLRSLTLEETAGAAFSSLYHYHRMFRSLTGYSLKEYIRLRRLSVAAGELALTKRSIVGIAYDAGYESPDAFCRAFRKFAGINPSEYRIRRSPVRLTARFEIGSHVETLIHGMRTVVPELVIKPAFTAVGFSGRFSVRDNQHLEGELDLDRKLCRRDNTSQLHGLRQNTLNVTLGGEPDFTRDEITILAGVEAADGIPVPSGLDIRVCPASCYARFCVAGIRPVIQKAWDGVFGEWIRNSGWPRDEMGWHLETWPAGWDGFTEAQVEIYIPLKTYPGKTAQKVG